VVAGFALVWISGESLFPAQVNGAPQPQATSAVTPKPVSAPPAAKASGIKPPQTPAQTPPQSTPKTPAQAPKELPVKALLKNQKFAGTAVGLLVAVIAYLLVLRLRPLLLLRLLPDEGVLLPIFSEKIVLGSRIFQALKYRPHVLDAWVDEHRDTMADRFSLITTVEQRRHHLELPVKVNQKMEPELTPQRLQELGAEKSLLLISGEGGVGKTSLALRIARWALDGKFHNRSVVPVMVEADLQDGESLLSRVRSTLENLIDHPGPGRLALPLVQALLERRRLLVILDHFSELGDESRQRLLPTADDFPSAWVIVTSRRREQLTGLVVLHLEPQRLTADRLPQFFTDYLQLKEEEEALDLDAHQRAVFRLREITEIVGQQGITVLLARLYIEVVLRNRQEAGGVLEPQSVPALMVTYVNQINENITEANRQPKELVVRALQHLAKASESTPQAPFRPQWVDRHVALQALTRAMDERQGREPEQTSAQAAEGVELLRYLVDRLVLVEESDDGEKLRLLLDPLADYLAARGWLRQLDREGDVGWQSFLKDILPAPGTEAEKLARGFLRALYDCAVNANDRAVLGQRISQKLEAQLAERAAIDPDRIAAERERRRLRRLIDDLADPDLAVRLQAIEELCRRRSREAMVSDALARTLASEQQDPQARQAAAIALAVQGGEAAARALAEAVASPIPKEELFGEGMAAERAVRRTALEALGLVASRLPAELGEQRREWMDLLERQLRADQLDLLVTGEEGWAEHDAWLPLLQGASRGLQLAASAELPLLGSGPGRKVPMLTLTALQEGEGLHIRTEVVEREVWKLPLPDGQQLELVVVEGGKYAIGSPREEVGRDWYATERERCKDLQTHEPLDVEAQRTVRTERYWMVRHLITQAQWRTVSELPRVEKELSTTPATDDARGLWEAHAQPGGIPVASVSWNDCEEWLKRLNHWLTSESPIIPALGETPKLVLPSESQWEAACRARTITPFHFGDVLDSSWANFDGGYQYGNGRKGSYRQRQVPVGSFGLVNHLGLAEMHGQLFEWCGDQWHPDPKGGPIDGKPWEGEDPILEGLGTAQKEWKLLRGGSWFDEPRSCRAAFRLSGHPTRVRPFVGLRPCCLLTPRSLLGS
jgi:formylglycine-generating enzyme required for sulfatase activity